MRYDVTGFGALNMDRLHLVDKIAGPDEESFITDVSESCGGSAANTVIGVSRLGLKTAYIGKVADDPEGDRLRENLRAEGVDRFLSVSRGGRSGRVMGFLDNQGSRALYVDPGVNDSIKIDEIDLKSLNTRMLHLSSFAGAGFETQKELLDMVGDSVCVSLDPGHLYARKGIVGLRGLLERTDILLTNTAELQTILGSELNLKDAAEELSVSVLVVKMGEHGVRAYSNGDTVSADALEVECVDTTGAGDAFNSGFIFAWLSGCGLEVSCRFGNYTASRCVTGRGATTALAGPEALEVLSAYMKEYGKK